MAIVNKKAMVKAPESSDSQESNIYLNVLALGAMWVVCNFFVAYSLTDPVYAGLFYKKPRHSLIH